MDALECLRSRASVRKYRKLAVSEGDLSKILEAGSAAPSSGNSQDWDFIVVREQGIKDSLSEAAMGQSFVGEADFVVVVCSNGERNKYGERGKALYSIQNSAAAAENMMLAAWGMGIGSCWIGAFNEGRVRDLLSIPDRVRPLAMITFGYPDGKVVKPGRLGMERVIHRERF